MADRQAKRRERQKGRTDREARHVRLDYWVLDTPAWNDLDPVSRCAYIEMKRRYWGTNNGQIVLSLRELVSGLGISLATASRALRNLEDHGFINTMQKGSFHRKVKHATEYRITEYGCDVTGALATKDFARWQKNTVSLVKLSVAVVKPIGIPSETEASSNKGKNPVFGISGETVSAGLGISGETHIDLPGRCASVSAVAVDVASAAESSASPRAAKLEPIRKPSPTHERRTKPKAA